MNQRLVSWTLGRVPGAAVVVAAIACAAPFGLAFLLAFGAAANAAGAVFGVFCFAVVVFVLGVIVAWVPAIAVALALYGVAAIEATSALGGAAQAMFMIATGAVLFVSFALADLSFSLRRSPSVSGAAWRVALVLPGLIVVAAAAVMAGVVAVATLSVWPAIVLPAALLVAGMAIKFGTDLARKHAVAA